MILNSFPIYTIIIFLYLYIPFVVISGVTIHLPYYYDLGLILIFFIKFKTKNISKNYLFILLLYSLGYIWILIISAINSTIDYDMQLIYLNGYSTFFSAYSLAYLLKNSKTIGSSHVIFAVFISGFIHSIIMALAFFIEPFKNILYSVIPLSDKGQGFILKSVRSPGLTSGAGDSLSVAQACTLIFGIVHLFNFRKKINFIKLVLYSISFSFIILSIFLSARTGFVILVLGAIVIILNKILSPKFFVFNKRTLYILIFLIPMGILLISTVVLFISNSSYQKMAYRAFELYFNYMESGDIYTSSTNNLKEMYFLPSSKLQTYFGDGNFGRDSNLPKIKSDIGYVRTIFGSGIVGTFLIYFWLIYILIICFKYRKNDTNMALLIFFIIFSIIIFNFKVFHFASKRITFKMLILIFSYLLLGTNSLKTTIDGIIPSNKK